MFENYLYYIRTLEIICLQIIYFKNIHFMAMIIYQLFISTTAITQECCEQYRTSPGSNTPQGSN